jgi:hypothetical protein
MNKMPQLVKGGKHIFGWSKVSEEGKIIISPEACEEYNYTEGDKVIVMSGSKTSGGFSVLKIKMFMESSLSEMIKEIPRLMKPNLQREEILKHKNKKLCWTLIGKNCSITFSHKTLQEYNINVGDMLLAARGSVLDISFLSKGPILDEALKCPDLDVFE